MNKEMAFQYAESTQESIRSLQEDIAYEQNKEDPMQFFIQTLRNILMEIDPVWETEKKNWRDLQQCINTNQT